MTIFLSDAGKRFNREWIFRHFTFTFETGQSYAIIGPNGSGKSTLLQVISGSMMISEGTGSWQVDGNGIPVVTENIFKHISLCAPYLDVVEEMTVTEFLEFHHGFKPLLPGLSIKSIIAQIGLEKAANKQIRNYSSGMKQRVKLAQCIFSDTPVILLDEPCTNLDQEGIALYQQLIQEHGMKRLVIVSSNDEVEYSFCKTRIAINDYKK